MSKAKSQINSRLNHSFIKKERERGKIQRMKKSKAEMMAIGTKPKMEEVLQLGRRNPKAGRSGEKTYEICQERMVLVYVGHNNIGWWKFWTTRHSVLCGPFH